MVIDKLKRQKTRSSLYKLTAAPIEEVAVDLKVAAEREAAAKLQGAPEQGAQLPSIDEEVPDTVKGLGGARAAADARTKGYEQNINRITAESEQARANKLAADEAQAAQIAAEPNSTVPAIIACTCGIRSYDWGFRYGRRSARRCSPQVIPATITVPQAPITPEKQVEPVTEKLWKEMGFSNTTASCFLIL
jgi:hypothetical protein